MTIRNNITIIRTGGTIDFIDPAYDYINEQFLKEGKHAGDYTNDIIKPANINVKEFTVCEKDSRDLTDKDRQKLLEIIDSIEEEKILITHGTFTLTTTAKYLEENLSEAILKNKKIILTGSMVPLHGFTKTDAPFNIGFSMAALMFYPENGIFISMNAGVFKADEIAKNLKKLKFEEV